jgi:hypothetical protein
MEKNHCSATGAADALGFGLPEQMQTMSSEAFSVYDCNGVRLVFFLPNTFGSDVKEVNSSLAGLEIVT